MKLYYDMLIPFFPEYSSDDEGNAVRDEKLVAGRSALIMLSNFQKFNNPEFLYRATLYASAYAAIPLHEMILNARLCETDFETPRIDSIIDSMVIHLVNSAFAGGEEFSPINFCAAMLMCAHRLIEQESANPTVEVEEVSDNDDVHPILDSKVTQLSEMPTEDNSAN